MSIRERQTKTSQGPIFGHSPLSQQPCEKHSEIQTISDFLVEEAKAEHLHSKKHFTSPNMAEMKATTPGSSLKEKVVLGETQNK